MQKLHRLYNWLASDSDNAEMYSIAHKGVGLVYLIFFIPLYFQIEALIGCNGLLPAKQLLETSYADQGYILSILQFPSFFHLAHTNGTLYLLITAGCTGALLMLSNKTSYYGAVISWLSFISITSIGSDFFIIIIDLFLAEVGFLSIFSCYCIQKYGRVPNIVDTAYKILNFRLWFCMGINKFYMPKEVWKNFTFFNYFFQAQPMPTPLARYFHYTPQLLKHAAEISLFIGEVIVPFFVFGKRHWRVTAFITFILISILIELNGNYGHFNVLSIVLALTILKSGDLYKSGNTITLKNDKIAIPPAAKYLLSLQITLQLFYCIYVFDSTPYSPQNHFNYYFSNKDPENKFLATAILPFKWLEYWRICNPYGVFNGIPYYHGELRFSGSYNNENWETYKFRFLPSGATDYLGYFAPVYPRLDHVMFYETLSQGAYLHNPLNKYSRKIRPWVYTFMIRLMENDPNTTHLLKDNPFNKKAPPLFIKVESYKLKFSPMISPKNWLDEPTGIVRYYDKKTADTSTAPILKYHEAMETVFGKQ